MNLALSRQPSVDIPAKQPTKLSIARLSSTDLPPFQEPLILSPPTPVPWNPPDFDPDEFARNREYVQRTLQMLDAAFGK